MSNHLFRFVLVFILLIISYVQKEREFLIIYSKNKNVTNCDVHRELYINVKHSKIIKTNVVKNNKNVRK